ncbi:FtsW/RodA/SpoVE family cell cycle protein [Thiohalocapsa marina]|nr:FtsW/RodA/SpoVE family cell cycle protein [Thiohalocapsa marina]
MSRVARPESLAKRWAGRGPERQLLFWVLVAMTLGFLMLLGAGPKEGYAVRWADLVPLAGLALSFGVAHLLLTLLGFRGDQVLLPVAAFLCGIGLLGQFRMGAFSGNQASLLDVLILPGGVALMLCATLLLMNGRYRLLAPPLWFWALLSVALVALLLVTGQRFRGGVYAAGYVTPTEPLKLTVVLFAAAFIAQHAKALAQWSKPIPFPPLRPLWPLLAFAAVLLGLLLVQRDLGMALILSLTLLALLAAGTGHLGYPIYGALGATLGGWALLSVFSHGQRRVETWLDPFQDPTGAGWQVLQGLSGMYAGGLWGEGFGQARPQYTPIAESDFIYAVIAEELGFAGSALVLVFFVLLIGRLDGIAARARSPFGALVATGIATVLAVQTLLNVGGVTKSIPLTGITLPFISHGGSSLITVFVGLGLALAISDGEPRAGRRQSGRKQSERRPGTGRKGSVSRGSRSKEAAVNNRTSNRSTSRGPRQPAVRKSSDRRTRD